MFDNRNSGMKMVLAQDMLLIIVSHDTGDFTSKQRHLLNVAVCSELELSAVELLLK